MILSFFLKGKQKSRTFIFLIISLIILLSLRTNPDEYLRYLYIDCSTIEKIFAGFPFSESVYRFLGFLSLKTFNPRFSIYFISYGLMFLCLNYSLKLYNLDFQYRIIPIAFYLSHYFLTLSYIAIRGGLSNTIVFLSISILLNRNNFKIASILALIAFFIQLQVVPFLLIAFASFYIKDIRFFKSKYFLAFIMPSIFVMFLNLRSVVQKLMSNFLTSNITFDPKYFTYLSHENYGYQINIFSNNVLFSFVLQIFLTFVYIYFLKIKDTNFRIALILASSYPLIMVFFSNSAIYAYRFASPFVLLNLPLIGLISKKMDPSLLFQKKARISFLIIIAIIASLLFYNLFGVGRLDTFSFTLERSADYLRRL